jgi:hypothetical protein
MGCCAGRTLATHGIRGLLVVVAVKSLPRMIMVIGAAALVEARCRGGDPLRAGNDGGSTSQGAANLNSADGSGTESGPSVAACDHYFAAEYLRCGGPRPPADETARIKARFEHVCANQIALAGSGVTPESLEACASALDVSPCELPAGPPVACQFRGSLPGAAACADDVQCGSGHCDDGVLYSPEGPVSTPKCGTCEAVVGMGKVCAHDTFSAGCASGSICLSGDTSAPLPTYSCTSLVEADVGTVCDDLAGTCKPGLYCAAQTGRCAPLGGIGAPCGEGAGLPGDPGGCVAPLGCVGLAGAAICSSGGAGASCLSDLECDTSLGCVPSGPCATNGEPARFGCSPSGQCVAITWAEPGQPCSDAVRCRVGSCDFGGGFAPTTQNPDGSLAMGNCPAIVPDGEPCTVGSTCDTFSGCFAGKCGLIDSVACK